MIADPVPSFVYDRSGAGHRANYVRFVATLVDGAPLIAPVSQVWRRLITAKALVLTTYESAPGIFGALILLRSMLGRRTVAIFLRAHMRNRDRALGSLRLIVQKSLIRLPHTRFLSIVPVPASIDPGGRIGTVMDFEFCDLDEAQIKGPDTDLSRDVVVRAGGRQILLFTGGVEDARGIGFLAECVTEDLTKNIHVVVAGQVHLDAQASVDRLEAAGAHIIGRFITDQEMMSLFRIASAVWCCFRPDRDMSSGVFGRAVQFGAAPIVRTGSILDTLALSVPNAVRLEFGNALCARARIAGGFVRSAAKIDENACIRGAIRSQIMAGFGNQQANMR